MPHAPDGFVYHVTNCTAEAYVGTLAHGDENELFWVDASSNFFDLAIYGGYGDIGHIIVEANAAWPD